MWGPNVNALLLYSSGMKCHALTAHVNITFSAPISEKPSTICLSSRFSLTSHSFVIRDHTEEYLSDHHR